MIELPASPAPNSARPGLLDFGFLQRPPSGAAVTRVDRPGNRHKVDFTLPPMEADDARVFVSRLKRAVSEGLRIPYPLLGVSQGNPGAPTVDGIDSAGTTLKLANLTPGYVAKEGYWLTLIGPDGVHYLHSVAVTAAAGIDGKVTLTVEPPLRCFPANGNSVLLAKPLVEGIVTSGAEWDLPVNRLVTLGFTLEESA